MIKTKLMLTCLLSITPTSKSMYVQLLIQPNATYQVQEQPRINARLLNRIRQLSYTLIALALVFTYSALFYGRPASLDDSSSQAPPTLSNTRRNIMALGTLCISLALLLQVVYCMIKN